jgi:hypothetical protein
MRRATALGITSLLCVVGLALAVAGCVSRKRRRAWAVVGLGVCLIVPAWPIAFVFFTPRPRDLVMAIERCDARAARSFLARGLSPESVALNTWALGGGRTALTAAVATKRLDLVDLVLDAGANIEAADPSGDTPLIVAIGTRDPLVVTHLLDRGAKLNARDARGHTAISWAAAISTTDVIGLLIERGADPQDPLRPALHAAVERDRDDVVRFLAGRGIVPTSEALTLARKSGARRAASALIALGAFEPPTTAPSAAIDPFGQ